MPFDFGEESVNSGDVSSLQCTVFKGDLPVRITWLLNNNTIEPERGIVISKVSKKVSSLTIDSVGEEHSGTYTCKAHNCAGQFIYSADLHVNGIKLLSKYLTIVVKMYVQTPFT